MHWIDTAPAWTGEMPVALITQTAGAASRRAALRALAARALGVDEGEVVIEHAPGRAPRLVRPAAPLALASSSRLPLAALAIARGPVGIDVEIAHGLDTPWLVLHPAEAGFLRALPDSERPAAFARLWSLKEAYLKALGTGLAREPSGFAVRFTGGAALIDDPETPGAVVEAATRWRQVGDRLAAVSAVLLHPSRGLM